MSHDPVAKPFNFGLWTEGSYTRREGTQGGIGAGFSVGYTSTAKLFFVLDVSNTTSLWPLCAVWTIRIPLKKKNTREKNGNCLKCESRLEMWKDSHCLLRTVNRSFWSFLNSSDIRQSFTGVTLDPSGKTYHSTERFPRCFHGLVSLN